MDISDVKKELLNLISEHRKRIPPDLLARAEMLAIHELEQQNTVDVQQPSVSSENTIQDEVFDKSAARNVIAHFLENYNEDPERLSKIKDIILQQSH